MPIAPLSIEVYDKNFIRRGMIGAPKFVTVIPRYNKAGTATIGVLATDRMVPRLIESGARMVLKDQDGKHLMSGYVTKIRGSGPSKTSLIEFDIEDDFAILGMIVGWVIPTATIDAQGSAGTSWTMTGNAESVLKAAVTANATTRLGMNLICAPNLNRGSSITANLRFHPLYDRLFPITDGAGIDGAGIGVTVKQVGTNLVLDVFTPSVYPRSLTEPGGTVIDWSYTVTAPVATRTVVGGQGEAQIRVFRTVTDAVRETEYKRIIERFRDARDVADVPVLYERGQQTIDEGAPKSGVSVTLSQTKNFQYGKAVSVGDRVTIDVGMIAPIIEILREATLSWTQADGWKTTPKVGDVTDNPDAMLARMVKSLARRLSNQNRT